MLFEPVKNYSILFSITDATYYDFDKSIQYGNIEGQAFYSNFKGILVSCSVVMIRQEKKKLVKIPILSNRCGILVKLPHQEKYKWLWNFSSINRVLNGVGF